MKKTVLRQYARLIAQKGGNVQKGQDVLIFASLDQPEFVKMVAEECYACGARMVRVEWSYQPMTKLTYKKATVTTLSKMEEFEVDKLKYRRDKLPVHIYIESEDPDGLKGINQAKVSKASQARFKIIKPYREARETLIAWGEKQGHNA